VARAVGPVGEIDTSGSIVITAAINAGRHQRAKMLAIPVLRTRALGDPAPTDGSRERSQPGIVIAAAHSHTER
jgi:hypothetical protein